MALFQCDVEKLYQGEYWTNVYYVDADTLVAASAAANEFAQMERVFHKNSVTFTKARTRSTIPGDDAYVNTTLNTAGLVEWDPVLRLPLFNVVRVDIGIVTGRPSRKYYRLPLMENEITNGEVTIAVRSSIESAMAAAYAELTGNGTPWVDIDGQQVLSFNAFIPVGMRQLRRGSKRKATPVLP